MELRLLGPVRACVGEDVLPLGPRQQRLVLALLALEVNRPVPLERLISWIWPDEPPRTAAHAVRVYVSHLRSILAKSGDMTITAEGTGYLLRAADPSRIDVHRFRDDVARAKGAANDRSRVALLDRALRLWTGPALADTAPPEIRDRLCGGLEETRLVAVEDRFDALLRLGAHQEAVGEITALVDAHPARERLVGQLMLALHRTGQTSRALEVARRVRAHLAEELGIDPGPELQRLELAILRNDPALALSPPRPEPTDVPARRTRLIGRDRDVADVLGRLGTARLLTLTGPGGVGKTQLALEAAREWTARHGDPVAVVSLAPVRDPNLVLTSIAGAIGVQESAGVAVRTALAAHLAQRRTLLVLDNLEHLLDAGPDIGWLLDSAPGLTVLVTSRAPLRLGGEHLRAVDPLDATAAIELFAERAAQAGSPDTLDSVVTDAICQRVDRLPLAIELAAARTRILSPAALLEQLTRSHDLLADGAADLPARHRSLRATLDWSYDLLTGAEQAMLHATATFAGTWSPAAAATVADLDPTTALRRIAALLDASLIIRIPGGDQARFALLETVRVFALAQAEHEGTLAELRRRHTGYVEGFIEAARQGLEGPDYRSWLALLRDEQDEVRIALRWLLDRGELDRCAALLVFPQYWTFGGQVEEYQRWSKELLTHQSGALSPAARAGVLALSSAAVFGTDHAGAIEIAERAVRLARGAGDVATLALALLARGQIAMWTGDNELALALLIEAETAFREVGAESFVSVARCVQATVTMSLGEPDKAHRLLLDLEAERRNSEATWDLGVTLAYRGFLLIRLGEWAQADRLVREAVAMLNHLGRSITMLNVLHYLCATAAHTGQPRRCARLAGAAAALLERLGPSMVDDMVAGLAARAATEVTGQLGERAWEALFREGRVLSWSEAMDLAGSADNDEGSGE